ncbi:MAG: membrane dipeptidase [Proteobacteria bacterium]|nr:membrane dipeptidase [Pseudomonadota bacterium]
MGAISQADAARLGLSPTARALHEQSLVIDLHVDCLIQHQLFGYALDVEHDPERAAGPRPLRFALPRAIARLTGAGHRPLYHHADLPRLRRGGYDCAALTLHYWPWASEGGWRSINRQLDYVEELLTRDPRLTLARSPAEVRSAAARGVLAIFLAVEGLHCLGSGGKGSETRRLDRLAQLRARGVAYVTLAHLRGNDGARNGFGLGSDPDAGLTPFGREVVRQMNAIGLVVDVAHVSRQGVIEVCQLTQRPVIASHTALLGVEPRRRDQLAARLLDDDGLRAVADTDGAVGLILCPRFLHGRDEGGLEQVLRQLRYGTERLAPHHRDPWRHFALGSDFDGWIPGIPRELKDAADLPLLTAALSADGLSATQCRQFLGENFLRVWDAVLSGCA